MNKIIESKCVCVHINLRSLLNVNCEVVCLYKFLVVHTNCMSLKCNDGLMQHALLIHFVLSVGELFACRALKVFKT